MSKSLSLTQALMVLNGLPNIGPISLNRLLDRFEGDALKVLEADPRQLKEVEGVGEVTANSVSNWQEQFNLDREETLLEKHGATFVTSLDSDYPGALKNIHDPPIGLYFLGKYRVQDPSVAIVGTRRPTLYGRGVATRLASELARMGFCVVSGMARGIDTEAHRGCLRSGGKTAAVMGCGLDIIYPPENLELYREISKVGAVLSEFPFGRRADRQTFPMRNRLVSGLCMATVVVESDVHGGSMITARFAGEQGRQVFSVPGRIDQAASRGCNRLIRDGAILLTSVDDILEEFNYLGLLEKEERGESGSESSSSIRFEELNETQKLILQCFEGGAELNPDSLAELTSLNAPEVASNLMTLELKRFLVKRADGLYERSF